MASVAVLRSERQVSDLLYAFVMPRCKRNKVVRNGQCPISGIVVDRTMSLDIVLGRRWHHGACGHHNAP